MKSFFDKTGKMALGSRLRMLTARFTDDATEIYKLYDLPLSPKWFPVLFILIEDTEKTITEIAEEIGHSQPSVTKIIKEMAAEGLVASNLKSADKRTNVVKLSEKGQQLSEKLKVQLVDVEAAVETLTSEARHNLWEAIAEWEFLLDHKSLLRRVNEEKKLRESKDVRIVAYEDKYQSAFKQLNEEWISTYFKMEEADYKALDNPKTYILDRGGKI